MQIRRPRGILSNMHLCLPTIAALCALIGCGSGEKLSVFRADVKNPGARPKQEKQSEDQQREEKMRRVSRLRETLRPFYEPCMSAPLVTTIGIRGRVTMWDLSFPNSGRASIELAYSPVDGYFYEDFPDEQFTVLIKVVDTQTKVEGLGYRDGAGMIIQDAFRRHVEVCAVYLPMGHLSGRAVLKREPLRSTGTVDVLVSNWVAHQLRIDLGKPERRSLIKEEPLPPRIQ